MRIIILGSGTSVPHPRRSASGFVVETEKSLILLDCSASAVHRLAQEKIDWANLDAIWISHFHLDHVGGLAAFLFGTKYAPETQNRSKPLEIFGAKGLQTLLEKFSAANDYELLKQPFPLEINEVEPLEKFVLTEDVDAVTLKTPHTSESLALHLRAATGETLVYTADTGFTMTLGDFARGVDFFVTECSFVKEKPVETHLNLTEAMHLIRYAKPRRAMLTHFYPEWDEYDFRAEVEKFTPPCEIIEAQDGLRLEID